jgi:hypothetical protein
MHRPSTLLLSALLVACVRGDVAQAGPPVPVPGPTQAPPAPTERRASAAPRACNPAELPLRVFWFEQRADRAFVPVVKDGAAALFMLDTGAAITHLVHGLALPPFLPSAGVVALGCQPRTLDSWRQRPVDGVDGLEVIGSVGADVFLGAPTELDLRRGVLRFHDRLPAETSTWPSVPFDVKDGVMVISAEVDGYPVRLLFDTGTNDLTLLTAGIDDRAGVASTDVFGNKLRLVWGSASLVWGSSAPRIVTAWRTRSFPAFEQQARTWGGTHGLLGLSSFGARRLVVDGKRGRIYLGPS